MRIKECIDRFNHLKPNNPYTDKDKVAWLNECEGLVMGKIFLSNSDEMKNSVYKAPEQQKGEERDDAWAREKADKELKAEFPHDDIYLKYLIKEHDKANGEYRKYLNSKADFDLAFADYMRWFATMYRPADNDEEAEIEEY